MEIMTKTIEYLQPNPASRAKLSMINTMSKIRGQEKGPGYPQAEALLAEAMLKFGRELGDDCNFGPALGEVGEAMRELSEVKDSLDMEVKQNFIDPLQNLHDKDLREIQHHLKKLEGRRLDFDYKKKRQGKIPDEELRQALEKFDESKEIAESSMFNLLEMDIEQVSQLSALVQAQLEYHKQAVQILQQVTVRLEERIRQASSQPRREYQPKPRMSLEFPSGDSTQPNGGLSHMGTPKPAGHHHIQASRSCASDMLGRLQVLNAGSQESPPSKWSLQRPYVLHAYPQIFKAVTKAMKATVIIIGIPLCCLRTLHLPAVPNPVTPKVNWRVLESLAGGILGLALSLHLSV
nr:endophilin-A1 isoform X2 [Camelus bactrianus]